MGEAAGEGGREGGRKGGRPRPRRKRVRRGGGCEVRAGAHALNWEEGEGSRAASTLTTGSTAPTRLHCLRERGT